MTNLTDRMRTCAAFIMDNVHNDERLIVTSALLKDAAALLIEASDLLEAAVQPQYPPGVPMEIIPPVTVRPPIITAPTMTGTWIDPGVQLPTATPPSRNACPKCDSRASKTAHRQGNHFVLECSVCGHAWKR